MKVSKQLIPLLLLLAIQNYALSQCNPSPISTGAQEIESQIDENNYEDAIEKTHKFIEYGYEHQEDSVVLLGYFYLEYLRGLKKDADLLEEVYLMNDTAQQRIINEACYSQFYEYRFSHLRAKASIAFLRGDYMKTRRILEEGLIELNKIDKNSADFQYFFSEFNSRLSLLAAMTGEIDESNFHLEESFRYNIEVFSKGDYYYQKGYNYQKQGEINKAHEALQKSIEIYEQNAQYFSTDADRYNMFLAYLRKTETAIELSYFEDADNLIQKLIPQLLNLPYLAARNLSNAAKLSYARDNYAEAKQHYDASIRLIKSTFGNNHPYTGSLYNELGKTLAKQKRYTEAENAFETALKILLPSTESEQLIQAPKETLRVLADYSEYYFNKYQTTSNEAALTQAANWIKQTLDINNEIRTGFISDFNKSLLSEQTKKISTQALKIGKRLLEIEDSAQNRNFLLRAAEAAKSAVLSDAVFAVKANKFAGVPDSILNKEQNIRLSLTDLEKQIFDLTTAVNTEEKRKELQTKRQDIKVEFENIKKTIALNYPAYYELKFSEKEIQLETLQAMLTDDKQMIIEYSLLEDEIFVFLVSKKDFKVKVIPRSNDLEQQIQKLRLAIINPEHINSEEYWEEDAKTYTQAAWELYNSLVKPLGQLPEELIIIPDGFLYYLPFNLLLSQAAEQATAYASHSYLNKEHLISYDYSLAIHQMSIERETREGDFLIFAPSYEGSESYLPLHNNIAEAESIQKIFNGQIFSGKNANCENFRQEIEHCGIFHFAGHAKMNELKSEYSVLAFHSDNNDNKECELPLSQLYSHKIPAEMVVLSACNSGNGDLQQGEGVYSLGRAFTYAGAKSLLSSSWPVNDQSSKELMLAYYEYLSQGLKKNKALQMAQKDLISGASDYQAHPMFWGSYMLYGNIAAIENRRSAIFSSTTLVGGIISLFLLLTAVFFWRKTQIK